MYWIQPAYWPLFCQVRRIGNRLVTLKSHHNFLEKCNNLNLVAKGINLKSNINLGDEELFIEIERSVFDTSKDIQMKVIDWLRREIKTVTGIYYKGRQELIWGLGRWKGTRSIRIIENDLNILEYELAKVKYRKLADLREI